MRSIGPKVGVKNVNVMSLFYYFYFFILILKIFKNLDNYIYVLLNFSLSNINGFSCSDFVVRLFIKFFFLGNEWRYRVNVATIYFLEAAKNQTLSRRK